MRNFGALILAAFYLIITSGISTCFYPCCMEAQLTSTAHALNEQNTSSCDEDHCCDEPSNDMGYHVKSKACDCCVSGAFTVKENITGSLEFQLEVLPITISSIVHSQENWDHINIIQSQWLIAKGPPGLSKPFLYILNSSFLI
jgi:hypothetical protein